MSTVVDRDLRKLAPKFGLALVQTLNEMRWLGFDPVVFEAVRSEERQQWLFAQGRTRPGQIVTNARSSLTSWHGFGLAVDVISQSQLWSAPQKFWIELGRIGKMYNLVWGGDWAMRDLPHLQWGSPMRASPSPRAAELLREGGLERVWKEVKAI